jgi:hypothetical protein
MANAVHHQAPPQTGWTQSARRSWRLLTRDEQRALLLVLALFVLGIGVRTWYARHTEHSAYGVKYGKE